MSDFLKKRGLQRKVILKEYLNMEKKGGVKI
jgi:hypothetical protein